jgi:hypothetical protein
MMAWDYLKAWTMEDMCVSFFRVSQLTKQVLSVFILD